MKRKLVWLNIALAVLIVIAGIKIRDEWSAQRKRVESLRRAPAKAAVVAPPAIPPAPAPVIAASYSDIANKMLFSKERNPNVVVDVAPAPPPKPMPPLPVLHGIMGLPSGTLALMSVKANSPGKGFQVGEKIGEFQLLAVNQDEITFKWEDKTVTRSVSEMIYHGLEQAPEKAPAAPAPAAASAAAPAAAEKSTAASTGKPGGDVTGSLQGWKSCTPGDSSPNGSVADGFRKVVVATPFGASCHWEPAK